MFDAIEPISVSLWAAALALVGLPVVYVAKGFLPWSRRLWVDGDHDAFVAVQTTMLAFHWASTLLVAALVVHAGHDLAAVGVRLPESTLVTAASLAVVAAAFAWYAWAMRRADPIPVDDLDIEPWRKGMLPADDTERWVMAAMSVTAGVCEEFVFRGFGLLALLGLGLPLPAAVVLASVSFMFLHGLAVLNPYAAANYFAFGVGFAAVFLWFGSLLPVVAVHAAYDAVALVQNTSEHGDHAASGAAT